MDIINMDCVCSGEGPSGVTDGVNPYSLPLSKNYNEIGDKKRGKDFELSWLRILTKKDR